MTARDVSFILGAIVLIALGFLLANVPPLPWLFWGLLIFGFAVGLLSGMSKSPVVTGLLPLLFAFAGGSVIALTAADNGTPAGRLAQQTLLGQELVGFGAGIIFGAVFGALLRKMGVNLELLGRA